MISAKGGPSATAETDIKRSTSTKTTRGIKARPPLNTLATMQDGEEERGETDKEAETETARTMKHSSKRGMWHIPRCAGRLLMRVALSVRRPELRLRLRFLEKKLKSNLLPVGTRL